MTLIAISYRSDDAEVARALHSRLASRLGEGTVFLAEQSIRSGHHWERALNLAFAKADLVLAVVGKFWAVQADGCSRLGPDDYVRKELDAAQRGRCKVFVPILVGDTPVPHLDYLGAGGDAVLGLFKRQALRLEPNTSGDVQRVCDQILSIVIGVLGTYMEFPLGRVAEAINSAETRFHVWHTWTEYFRYFLRRPLRKFMESVWRRHDPCRCRFLLAHPDCSYAELRAKSIRGSTLHSLLEQTLVDLKSVAVGAVGGAIDDALEVRLYTSYPTTPLYIVDEKAFVGWYPPDTTSHDSAYAEVGGPASNLFVYLESTFQATWDQTEWKWDFDKWEPRKVNDPDNGNHSLPAL